MAKSQKLHVFLITNFIVLVHGGSLRHIRDARIPEHEEKLVVSEEDVHEVHILPKPHNTEIKGDIGEPPPFDKSSEEYDEEMLERELLEQLSRLQLQEMRIAESIENTRLAQVNGVRNGPVLFPDPKEEKAIIPINVRPVGPPKNLIGPTTAPVRTPAPIEGRLPNKMYTDINRVGPINEYLQSQWIPPQSSRPIPAPEYEMPFRRGEMPFRRREDLLRRDEMPFRREEIPFRSREELFRRDQMPFRRGEMPYRRDETPFHHEEIQEPKEQEPKNGRPDLIKVLLDRVKPDTGALGNRNRWASYLGHVLLHALTTIIDGTQVALKEYTAASE